MGFSKIAAVAYHLPERILSDTEIARLHPEWDIARISQKTGIVERRRAGEDETALDLGVRAAERLFGENGLSREMVDAAIFCTQNPDYVLPPNSCLAHARLGLRADIPVYDLSHGCAGFVSALSMADALVRAGRARHVLVITADTYSKRMNPADRTVQTLFGDAGAATLVSESDAECIGSFAFDTDGAGAKNLIVPMSGARGGEIEGTASPGLRGPKDLYMNGREIMAFALSKVPELMDRSLGQAGFSVGDIDWFVFHQANVFMLENLKAICGLPDDRFVVNMQKIGNTVSASIPIALRMAKDEIAGFGGKILIAGFGVGYESGVAIISM